MWYNATLDKRQSEKQVRNFVLSEYSATLPRKLTAAHVKPYNVHWAVADMKPEITALQIITVGPFEKRGANWYQTWVVKDKFQTPEQELAFFESEQLRLVNVNRESCEAFILGKYSLPIQSSAVMLRYGQEFLDGMTDHIDRIIATENASQVELEAVVPLDFVALYAVELPVYPEE
jgi:hypothetical protein